MHHAPFCPLGKNLIVGKLPTLYFSASGLLFFVSASTVVTRHCEHEGLHQRAASSVFDTDLVSE